MKAVLLFSLFCVCSCAGDFLKRSAPSLAKYEGNYSDSSFIRLISQDSLPGIFSKEHYLIRAYLPESSSRLELFSHFRRYAYDENSGIKIKFERKGQGLAAAISARGYSEKVLFEREDYFLSGGELDLTVEAENGLRGGFRVRIWENFVNRRGVLKERALALTDENLIADSLSKGLVFYDKGVGLKWGIKLFRARLIEGARVSPKALPRESGS